MNEIKFPTQIFSDFLLEISKEISKPFQLEIEKLKIELQEMKHEVSPYLSIEEASRYIGISKSMLYKKEQQSFWGAISLGENGRIIFDKKEIDKKINELKKKS